VDFQRIGAFARIMTTSSALTPATVATGTTGRRAYRGNRRGCQWTGRRRLSSISYPPRVGLRRVDDVLEEPFRRRVASATGALATG
jgi:hypothetical protein